MNSEPCLNVFVGCPPLLRKLPEGPCLILDADQAALDVFQQQNLVQEHSNVEALAGPDIISHPRTKKKRRQHFVLPTEPPGPSSVA